MNVKQLFIAAVSLFYIFSCAEGSSNSSTATKTVDGIYATCTDNGNGTSTNTVVTIGSSGTTMAEDITNYTTSDCTGSGSTLFSFTSTIVMGSIGQSTKYAGATDLIVTPAADSFGCGAGQATYSWVLFAANYANLTTPSGAPGCTPGTAPTSLDNKTLIHQ